MSRATSLLPVAAVALSFAALLVALSARPEPALPPPVPSFAPDPSLYDARERAFGRLAESVGRLAARVEALETAPRAVPGISDPAARPPSAPAAPAEAAPESPETVLSRVREIAARHADPREQVRLLDGILAGSLDDGVRGDALVAKGMALRALADHAAAAGAFEAAIRCLPSGSEAGGWATFQLAWERKSLGQPDEAIRLMEQVGRDESLAPVLRLSGRVRVAEFARDAGDAARARREAEAVIAEYGNRGEEWAVREVSKCRRIVGD